MSAETGDGSNENVGRQLLANAAASEELLSVLHKRKRSVAKMSDVDLSTTILSLFATNQDTLQKILLPEYM